MSAEIVKQFTVVVASNPTLAAKAAAAIDGKSPEDAAAAFSALGQGEGYEFSAADALEFRNAVVSHQLSDSELDSVAGGVDQVAQQGIATAVNAAAGAIVPGSGAGGVVGAIAGAAITTAVSGGTPAQSAVAGATAGASALDDFKNFMRSW